MDDELHVYIKGGDFGATYIPYYAVYILAVRAEHLEDLNTSSSRAKAPVNLIFLVKRGTKMKSKTIPRTFKVSKGDMKRSKTGSYNELKYQIYDTELRMEFYLHVLKHFCTARSDVLFMFAGGNFMCTAWVSHSS